MFPFREDALPAVVVRCDLMRLVIVGAGAVGGVLAALLHEAGHDVTVVARRRAGRPRRAPGSVPGVDLLARRAKNQLDT